MSDLNYKYLIVGGGLAGASAVEGIREIDKNGSILVVANENHLPYHRPPLSKALWTGKKTEDQILVHDLPFYQAKGIDIILSSTVATIDLQSSKAVDRHGGTIGFERLLLATGGTPRRLDISGGSESGICYYRQLDDYHLIRKLSGAGRSAVVIGAGFIGSEMAAALNMAGMQVTMVFPSDYPCIRIFPPSLGRAIHQKYVERGVEMLNGDMPVSFHRSNGKFIARTRNRGDIEADLVLAGVGIVPAVDLAISAGLKVDNGIVVDEYLETSFPGVFAAGDCANFPYGILGRNMRVEHWDNALHMGRTAGRNMAGAREKYDYMPYFFSDLFDFGYEAVGDVNPKLEVFTAWQKENDTGCVYFVDSGKVRGALMCNVWDKVESARELIRLGEPITSERFQGAVRAA